MEKEMHLIISPIPTAIATTCDALRHASKVFRDVLEMTSPRVLSIEGCKTDAAAKRMQAIVLALSDGQLEQAIDAALLLPKGDVLSIYETLDKYGITRALDAVHARLLSDLLGGRTNAKDVLDVFNNHAGILQSVIVAATDRMQAERVAAARKECIVEDGINAAELKAVLGNFTYALVLSDMINDDDDDCIFEGGYVILKIHTDTFPAGNTGRWVRFYRETPRTWDLYGDATVETACYMVIPFPATCNGGDNDPLPRLLAEWFGGLYREDADDDEEEVPVFKTEEEALRYVTSLGRIDVVVKADGSAGVVVYSSDHVNDVNVVMDGCVIQG